ncbi:MAG TPA: FtsX-like permease family protein, partial [Tepidisphaeraceae bacterium]|nr:FtsX-like permease family protein [Tepidisphaeraceae bacterium]
GDMRVQTWQEQQQLWLGAIENEIALTTFLFGLISLVAVALIFCIFYMIVIEKTRDIGILKSVGASPWNVAHIFLCYGATIGFVGGLAGVGLGWLVVSNINPLHQFVAKKLGFDIWNSNVYAFDDIPSKLSSDASFITFAVAIAAAVAGAGVPALRAAMLKPVTALRFE